MSLKKSIKLVLANFLRLPLLRQFSGLPYLSMDTDEYCSKFYATYSPQKSIVYPAFVQYELIPDSLNEDFYWKFKSLQNRFVPEAFVLKIEQGKVQGNKGAVITKEGIIIRDVSREFGHRNTHSLLNGLFLPAPVKYKGNVAVLITDGGNTYYHWLFDILPRLHLLQKEGVAGLVDFFILPEIKHSFQKESLALFSIPSSKIIEVENSNFYIEADNLFVPSLPSLLGTVNYWSSAYINQTILAAPLPVVSTGKKIYISRKKATARKLLNEGELITCLTKFGFTEIVSEDYSFLEQVAIFNNAETIIALHGSGLSNIVFCKPATKIVEFFSSDFLVPCYWILANSCSLKYYFISSEGRDNFPFKPYWEGESKDFYFPVQNIERELLSAKIIA